MLSHLIVSLLVTTTTTSNHPVQTVEGLTFAADTEDIYLPAEAISTSLKVPMAYDAKTNRLSINGEAVPTEQKLFDGTKLVLLRDLERAGVHSTWSEETHSATVELNGQVVVVPVGPKKVVVNLATQQLDAYQGNYLVFSTHVSTGKLGKRTPPGEFKVASKSKLHHSKLYNNAPMPWSVQVNGDIFIHGYKSVPSRPASHGCIRVPVKAAHWFFTWVDLDTPVSVTGEWKDPVPSAKKKADPEKEAKAA